MVMGEVLKALESSLRFRMFDNMFLLCQEYFCRFPEPRILYYYARAYIDSGSPHQATILLHQYEHVIDDDQELLLLRAQALFECGKYGAAEDILKSFDPSRVLDETLKGQLSTAVAYLSGLIKVRTHRFIQGQNDFERCARMDPLVLHALHFAKKENVSVQTPRRFGGTRPARRPKLSLTAAFVREDGEQDDTALPAEVMTSITVMKAQALRLFRRSKYHESAPVFRELYKRHPHTLEGVGVYSTVLWQLRDENALGELVRRAISISPSHPETWIAAGNFESLRHRSDEAIEMFRRAIKVDGSCSYAHALCGHEHLILDALKDATSYFRKAVDLDPREWSAWYGLGSCHFRGEKFWAAEYYVKKACKINPDSSVLNYVYGLILSKCSRIDEAMDAFDAAVRLDPHNLVASFEKANMLMSLGRLTEARLALEHIKMGEPREPHIAQLKAQIAARLGDIKESVFWFTAAVIGGCHVTDDMSRVLSQFTDHIVDEIINT